MSKRRNATTWRNLQGRLIGGPFAWRDVMIGSMVRTAVAFLALLSPAAQGQETPPLNHWQQIAANTTFETGDTWVTSGKRFRLYGVQSCLRGTVYVGPDGQKHDCGEVSLHMLVGLIRAWSPLCAPVARSAPAGATFVVCYADTRASTGLQRIDLGTALIASGFAFAALNANGRPVNLSYMVAENAARASKAGLWSASDVPNPNARLLGALRTAGSTASPGKARAGAGCPMEGSAAFAC